MVIIDFTLFLHAVKPRFAEVGGKTITKSTGGCYLCLFIYVLLHLSLKYFLMIEEPFKDQSLIKLSLLLALKIKLLHFSEILLTNLSSFNPRIQFREGPMTLFNRIFKTGTHSNLSCL